MGRRKKMTEEESEKLWQEHLAKLRREVVRKKCGWCEDVHIELALLRKWLINLIGRHAIINRNDELRKMVKDPIARFILSKELDIGDKELWGERKTV